MGFFVFLCLMWLCTIISKSIYASRLPIVNVDSAEQKYVEHKVEAEGIVEAGDKNPVTALSGIRVNKLMVQVGDRVEEGDVLFNVDMDDLDEIMEKKQTEISRLQLQINTILENEELARQKKALEEERAREDYDALSRYNNTLVGRAAEEVNQAENHIENQDGGTDEELKDALKSAAYAEADAKWARDNAVKEAERNVEDILFPEDEDATLSSYQLELTEMQKDLTRYQAIKNAEGLITAPGDGLITDIYIDAGSRIPESAVMLFADDAVPCQFKAVLDREQKSYVGLNDTVSLKLDGSRETEVTVDYLAESETMPGCYEIYINLPEGMGMPGLSGTMSHTETGEKYSCCISPLALHKEDTRSYVYVVKEKEGILGVEYYVEEVNVKVLDENESWAAVEGALDKDSRIIISATKEVHNGDIVRF